MSATGFRIASLIGMAGFIALPNDPAQFYVVLGVAITTAGGVVLQILKNKGDRARDAADRQERLDERKEMSQRIELMQSDIMASTARQAGALRQEILANTALTEHGIAKTEEFAETANNVNAKIASLAAVANHVTRVAVDTNKTVHGMDDKANGE